MKRLSNWYWQFAGARDGEWMLSPSWLDDVMSIQEYDKNICSFEKTPDNEKKATIAFWGPSQGGKSTFFSYYADELSASGKPVPEKSALTWSDAHKVVFSGEIMDCPPDCTIFNPANAGMDASGVVTRFYAPANEADVDIDFPAEVVLATPTLIMQSLACGYFTHIPQRVNYLEIDDIRDKIISFGDKFSDRVDPRAFLLLRELCDACEHSTIQRFQNFRNDPERKLRKEILNSPVLNSNYEFAKEFMAFILWNCTPEFTMVWDNLENLKGSLRLNENDRIFLTMKVAALVENISIADPGKGNPQKLNSVLYRKEGSRLLLFDSSEFQNGSNLNSLTCGEAGAFAYFQALVGELKMPLRNNSSTPQRKLLFDLLKNNDIIDIPGVTNVSDDAIKSDMELERQKTGGFLTDTTILTKAYKLGKTLAIIYSQAAQISIDAFMMFIFLGVDGGLKRPTDLHCGIHAWLEALHQPNDFKTRPTVKLYVNLSRFGQLLANSSSQNGYREWREQLELLRFANTSCADFLFSSNRFARVDSSMAQRWFNYVKTADFGKFCFNGSNESSFNALMNDPSGLGSDYIISRLTNEVNYSKRREIYQNIRTANREKLARKIAEVLPADGGNETMLRRSLLKEVLQKSENLSSMELMAQIKEIFDVPASIFDKLPIRTSNIQTAELRKYLERQISKWCMFQKERWENNPNNQLIPTNDGCVLRFFKLISSIDIDTLTKEMKICFAYLGNARSPSSTTNARSYVAMMLANLFLYGSIERKEKKYSKPTDMLNIPFRDRLEYLIENTPGASARPDFPGDLEMADIQKDLQNQGKC